jgi:beta-lactamase class D
MNRFILIFLFYMFIGSAFADSKCFIIGENSSVIEQKGDCSVHHSPCSTFKIAISLMGFDDGILQDATHPEWPFKVGYPDWRASWKRPHNPASWIRDSCVWYSQLITQQLGMEKFKNYVTRFHYGNEDVSGDKGQSNGLTHSWLSSSLQISGLEQFDFLQKLISSKLPVSGRALDFTKEVLFVEDLPDGWKLYGKTGGGYLQNVDGTRDLKKQLGWFVGWMEKGSRRIVFVDYIEDKMDADFSAARKAKDAVRDKLLGLIRSNKKA